MHTIRTHTGRWLHDITLGTLCQGVDPPRYVTTPKPLMHPRIASLQAPYLDVPLSWLMPDATQASDQEETEGEEKPVRMHVVHIIMFRGGQRGSC